MDNKNDLSMKVTCQEPVIIHPTEYTKDDEYYFLSNLDQNIAVIMKTVHLYAPTEKKSSENVVEVVREALTRVLVHFYPFCGSLTISSQGKLIVKCDRSGVPFVEGEADCDLESLGDISIPDARNLDKLVYVVPEARNLLETPLLTVQVTKFKCGGFVIGLAMNHCMADGLSCVEFMQCWAETAHGVPLSVPPFLDRTIQRARSPPKIEFPHHEFTDIEDVSSLNTLMESDPIEYRSFTIDPDRLNKLKMLASEDGSISKPSTFVTLSAFIWRARSKALKMRPHQKTKLLFAVDVRKRFNPPVPAGFFGNAIVLDCCYCEAQELCENPLSFAVRMVQDTIQQTTDRFVQSAIDYFEVTRARPSMNATVIVTTWSRLGFGSSDFGWGEAVQSGSAQLPSKEVALFLSPGKESKNTVVLMGLPATAMKEFQQIMDQI